MGFLATNVWNVQEVLNAFHAMWDAFPEPVTITQKSREILAVNKKAQAFDGHQ
ncbi:MAG: hypothetical protein IJU76_11140 [Desulfovibrionaceae bacterium]|nr:hypothetical protein [Desulfovibrionaceae bacterium]